MKKLNIEEQKVIYQRLEKYILNNKQNIKDRIVLDNDFIIQIIEVLLKPKYYFGKSANSILKYIDLNNFSLENIDMIFADLKDSNIKTFDPQKVLNKKLFATILPSIDFKGKCFDGVDIRCADFSNSFNVDIDPQKIFNKSLIMTTLKGIDFKNKNFDNVEICYANFEGSKNVDFDPQKIKDKCLDGANLKGIDFKNKNFSNVSTLRTIGLNNNIETDKIVIKKYK